MSGEYLGDFVGDETMVVVFDSFDSNGASVTITGLAVTDIEIYKGSSVTQRSSDAGYTLIDTDGIDIDGATGIHGFTVDLSDDTDTGFYAAGNDFYIVVNAVTIDTQTVRFIAARFSIQNRYMRGTDSAALASNYTSARAGYLDNINNSALQTTTAQTGDSYARLGVPAGASVSADIATRMAESSINTTGGAVDTVTTVTTCTTNTDMRGTDNALLASGYTAPDNASITAILADTNELQANQGNWLTATGFSTHSAADVMTTVMTESYNVDGAAATPAQALYLTMQALTEFAISGTTTTIKRLDGTTTAATLTHDDAANATSATRAT